ncbi:GH92 family glycosyl hydrolase [Streptomyces sp. NPDC059740]|uniref:GH92 family glycosyl hydrolase n=1 Tax=Streptomyces sp. NPDC059740 TaxID=3346926 RepID=UPI003647F1F9
MHRPGTGRLGRLLRHVLPVTVLAAGTLTVAGPARAADHPSPADTDLARYVNPFVGTRPGGADYGTGGGAGNTFPGADAPFGMVQWSPDTDKSQPGGYAWDDDKIKGFSLTHLSGAGCNGDQDLPFMPYAGDVTTSPAADPGHYLDGFSHDDESASPGSYSVKLASGTKVELAATQRSGAGRFTYPAGKTATMLLNVSGSIGGASDAQARVTGDRTVTGYVASGHFCGGDNTYKVYFSATFDRPFASVGTWHDDEVDPGAKTVRGTAKAKVPTSHAARTTGGDHASGDRRPLDAGRSAMTAPSKATSVSGPGSGAYVTFDTSRGASVGVKVGLSYVSVAGAAANARAEQGHASFDNVVHRTRAAWNSRLGQVAVSGGTQAQRATFYTALYHSLLQPNVFSDADGRYVGFDDKVHHAARGHAQYANFSGWDTYRSEMQLVSLLAPHEAGDMAQSMYNQAHQAGDVWDRWSVNNDFEGVMTGDPYHSIIASTYAFGATGFDARGALASMVKGATTVQSSDAPYIERPGLADYEKLGYIPGDVSTTLEDTTADFGIAQLAGRLGDTATHNTFMERAQNWQNMFNPALGTIQPRNRDGSFVSPYSPADPSLYVEGNGAQYQWMVPYDQRGLFDAMGGDEKVVGALDQYFTKLNAGPKEPYAFLGNEPSLGTPWSYDYAGAPYRTQDVVRQAVDTLYQPTPDGLVGNDDLGEMSSWYVWAAMGMYPAVPGRAELALASPLFPHVTVRRGSGQTLSVNAPGASSAARYVHGLKVDGRRSGKAWLPESFVREGGRLDYTLSTSPDRSWGSAAKDAPPSFRQGEQPYLTGTGPGRVKVQPGKGTETATVDVTSLRRAGTTVHWKADAPEGVTVSPSSGEFAVPGAGHASTKVTVSAAAGTKAGFYHVPLTLTGADGSTLPKAALAVTVGTPGTVLWYLNGNGISADDANPTANFDGGGWSYSGPALAAAGAAPGGTVTAGGFTWAWPETGEGVPDNIVVGGGESRVLDVPAASAGAGRLSLLGSATNGPSHGTMVLTYTDGTTQEVELGFSDWTLGAGAQQPSYGNTVALHTPYRDVASGGKEEVGTYVFASAPVEPAAGKELRSVTLPATVTGGAMHVFAVAVG